MTKDMNSIIEKRVVKRGNKWCVVHGKGKDEGKIIKCFEGKNAHEDALRMHRAIMYHRFKDLTNLELLDYTKYAILYKSVGTATKCFKEIARRKENIELDWNLKTKELPKTVYNIWKKIRVKLNNREIIAIIIKPAGYERLKEYVKTKSLKAGYYSKAKPFRRFELPIIHEDLEKVGWDKKILLVDVKIDGLRTTLLNLEECRVFCDPEDRKEKSPDVSNRLIGICNECEKVLPKGTIVDCEFYAARGKDAFHRTVANSILNSKLSAEKLIPYSFLFVFDILFWKGKDLRELPLEERLKYLKKLKSSEHIKIESISKQGYIVKGDSKGQINKAIQSILKNKHGLHNNIQEGCMFKDLSHKYEYRTNHGWGKAKTLYEIDTIAYDRILVKGQTAVWNYFLGIGISKDYFNKLPNKVKIELDGKYFIKFGKSDNSRLNVKPSATSVLRCASEEINKYDNEDYPNVPWYKGYINVVMQEVPEKNISDSLDVLERLSRFQPRRITIEELARLKNEELPDKLKSLIKKISNLNDNQLINFKKYLINEEEKNK